VTRTFAVDPTELGLSDLATPGETLEAEFFAVDSLPEPSVPFHTVRIEDGTGGKSRGGRPMSVSHEMNENERWEHARGSVNGSQS
jgi:hypothetical protein